MRNLSQSQFLSLDRVEIRLVVPVHWQTSSWTFKSFSSQGNAILYYLWLLLFFLPFLVYLLQCLSSLSSTIQFSSVAQLCLTPCNPMDCSTPGFPVLHYLPEFAQTHIHWCHPTDSFSVFSSFPQKVFCGMPVQREAPGTKTSLRSSACCILLCVCVCVYVFSCVQLCNPHGPARLLCPWNFPGKNTRAGCHFLLQILLLDTSNSDSSIKRPKKSSCTLYLTS